MKYNCSIINKHPEQQEEKDLIMTLIYSGILLVILSMVGYGVLTDRKRYQQMEAANSEQRLKMYRKWIVTSWLMYGLFSVVSLAILLLNNVELATPKVHELLRSSASGLTVGSTVMLICLLAASKIQSNRTSAEERSKARRVIEKTGGGSLIARNQQERKLAGLLSLSAGINEELLFRLLLPLVLAGLIGESLIVLALALSVLIFGLVHTYQGVIGVLTTTVLGMLLMFIYIATGSIILAMIVHTLIDLRSMVGLSWVAYGDQK